MNKKILSDSLISLKNITKQYGNKTAVKNFNLEIKPGERIALIGPNGSGKSTTSEIIGGIRKPTSGKIEKDKKLVIGFQFQESRYPHGITVMDMIKYYLETFQIKITNIELTKMLDTYQILHLANKMVQNLSGGQQQRLNILLSVIHQPHLVILDEVSTGLDIEVKEEIFNFLQTNVVDKNIAMILVSHNMSEIQRFCQRVIFMHEGVIVEDTTVSAILKEYGSVEEYMHQQLLKYKKPLQANIADEKLTNLKKPNNLVANLKVRKSTSLIKLISKYFLRGFFVPFYVLVYPIITLFLQGFAFKLLDIDALRSIIAGIAVMQIVAVGVFFIPQTIIEFKNSVLMKRIGITNISPLLFVGAIIGMGIFFSLVAFGWTLLWAGIFFGHTYSWQSMALPSQGWSALPFLLLIFASATAFGIMLSSVLKSNASYIAVSNIIYFPIAFLSGGLASMTLIDNNAVLKYATYINPFNYCVRPFIQCWIGKFTWNGASYGFLAGAIALLSVFIGISSWKMKWEE